MTILQRALPSGVTLQVRIEDFTPPWIDAPVVLMLHGTAETSEAYRLWMPWLARHFRVVAPDWRGMGGSDGVSADSRIEMADLVADAHALMQSLGARDYFVVGEKLGALAALSLAAAHPQEVRAMSLACGMVSPRQVLGPWIPEWKSLVATKGIRAWVDETQAGRMGDELDGPALEWWSSLMANALAPQSLLAYLDFLGRLEVTPDTLAAVRCPTLFLTPAGARPTQGRFDQRRPVAEGEAWRALVAGHQVAPIDCTSYHLAATRPDACAQASRDFFLAQ